MSDEVRDEILRAWNRYVGDQQKRYKKNEGSTTQHEDYCRLFRDGVVNHPRLNKREKSALLMQIGMAPPA